MPIFCPSFHKSKSLDCYVNLPIGSIHIEEITRPNIFKRIYISIRDDFKERQRRIDLRIKQEELIERNRLREDELLNPLSGEDLLETMSKLDKPENHE